MDTTQTNNNENKSIHTAQITEVYDIPVKYITRPVIPSIDNCKVERMMELLQVITKP